MTPRTAPLAETRKATAIVLPIAFLIGLCTMSYEVLWFRILTYFVDNSIHSFAIMLTAFLCGLTVGGLLFSRFIDKRKDPFLFLGMMEIGIALSCMLSIPMIAKSYEMIGEVGKLAGPSWGAEVGTRFAVFSLAMIVPTALMGGAFPLVIRIYSAGSASPGRSIGHVYGVNTIGCVFGSFLAAFVLLPWLGIQNAITAVSFTNLLIGIACIAVGSNLPPRSRGAVCGGSAAAACIVLGSVPGNAFLDVYSHVYPAPANELLYLKENATGTTAVFQDAKRKSQKYLLIDGRGEVSTDYFSMRAFRFLGLLPAFHFPEPKTALIVTFGSGIAAGSIVGIPGITRADCVEICGEAFNAAHFFASENHDVLLDPKIHLIVNDGRNYVLTTEERYDIISADATHPTSSDSWILYTREFYDLCRSRLHAGGIMSQWIPLHGILERDFKTILKTFHSAFPFVAVYYSGGHKTLGHTVLLGSDRPLTIDFAVAEKLFQDARIKEDLGRVNVFSVYDLLNGFMMDEAGIDEFAGPAPLNTDDKPRIIFSKSELQLTPHIGLAPIAKHRKSPYAYLRNADQARGVQIRETVQRNFEAMGYTIEGQILEFEEYKHRMASDPDQPAEVVSKQLDASKALFEQAISKYQTALEINPGDVQTRLLLARAVSEYQSLNAFLETIDHHQ
jgi:spermidine synthase